VTNAVLADLEEEVGQARLKLEAEAVAKFHSEAERRSWVDDLLAIMFGRRLAQAGDAGRPQEDTPEVQRATVAAEKRAIELVAQLLKGNANLTKGEAFAALSGLGCSKIGFQTRVWPKAREQVGLPARAKAGKKPNRPG
jgi:hypothetical protein